MTNAQATLTERSAPLMQVSAHGPSFVRCCFASTRAICTT
jgi:hypothetical protein